MGAPLEAMTILASLLPLCACEPTQLYLASHTVVGINAKVNPEQGTGTLLIGYDRTFTTVIPRSVDKQQDGLATRDAMSALACSSLIVEGITIRQYTESLATGQAAKDFAAKLASGSNPQSGAARIRDFFDCFKDQSKQQPASTEVNR